MAQLRSGSTSRRIPGGADSLETTGPRHAVLVGNLSGRQCLFVQGRIESEQPIRIQDAAIGPTGYVKAEIHGTIILVEGMVQGDLFGQEQIIIRRTATVHGNVTAPSVVLENGARLQGAIDTQCPLSPVADVA